MTTMKRLVILICIAAVFAGAAIGDPALFLLALVVGVAVGFGINGDEEGKL